MIEIFNSQECTYSNSMIFFMLQEEKMISDILFISRSAIVPCAVINQPDLCKLALKGAL